MALTELNAACIVDQSRNYEDYMVHVTSVS